MRGDPIRVTATRAWSSLAFSIVSESNRRRDLCRCLCAETVDNRALDLANDLDRKLYLNTQDGFGDLPQPRLVDARVTPHPLAALPAKLAPEAAASAGKARLHLSQWTARDAIHVHVRTSPVGAGVANIGPACAGIT